MCFHFEARFSFATFFLKNSYFLKKIVEIGQNGSKMLKIDTVSTYSTNCNSGKFLPIPPHTNHNVVLYRLLYTPWGFLSPPSLSCGRGNFSRDEYWMWEMAFSQIVWGRERGQKAYFTCHEEEGGLFDFFIFFSNFFNDIHNTWYPDI